MSNSILKILGITTKEIEETSPMEEIPSRLSLSSINEKSYFCKALKLFRNSIKNEKKSNIEEAYFSGDSLIRKESN